MPLRGSYRWTRQPPNGYVDLNPTLPNPWLVARTLGNQQQVFPAPAVTSTTYSGNGSASMNGELGVSSTGGIQHNLTAQPHRQIYAAAIRFQQLAAATTQSIFGFNGTVNGTQIRISTSEELQLLSEGAALLATSSYSPFGDLLRVNTLVVVAPATSGSTYFYLNGVPVMTYAGVVDNTLSAQLITLGRRGGAGEALNGVIYDAAFWSGDGNVPSLAQAQEISRNYYGTLYAPRRVGVQISSVAGGATTLTASPASYTLTDSDTTNIIARPFTASPASYTLTDSSTTNVIDRPLNAAPASYALTDSSITTLLALNLTASPASYVLTDSDATLTYTPVGSFSADAASYSLTANDATLIKALNLTASPASYSLTDSATTSVIDRPLNASAASYTLTGSDITTSTPLTLSADPASYVFAAVSADLVNSATAQQIGGHFGFDEKRRKKRFDDERDDEERRKRVLREAMFGLPPEEREEVTAQPEATIERAAQTEVDYSRLLTQIQAIQDRIDEIDRQDAEDLKEVTELIRAGVI